MLTARRETPTALPGNRDLMYERKARQIRRLTALELNPVETVTREERKGRVMPEPVTNEMMEIALQY